MAAVDSAPAPPPAPSSPSNSHKRKRSDQHDALSVNGLPNHAPSAPAPGAVLDAIQDIWTVLQRHDPANAILERVSRFVPSRDGPDGLQAKRQKVTDEAPNGTSMPSIQVKIDGRQYTSLQEFENDLESAAVDTLSLLSSPAKTDDAKRAPSANDRQLSAQLKAMIKLGASLIRREKHKPRRLGDDGNLLDETGSKVNGLKMQDGDHDSSALDLEQSSRTVLTLFGNAQGQKQLFSSLQLPQKQSSGLQDVLLPLKEDRLPHGILNTEIHPVANEDVFPETKRGQTFRDLYAAPPSIGQLQPPKSSKSLHTRSDRLSWAGDKRPQESTKRAGYTQEKLPTGNWLGYGGVVEKHEPVSPEAKRRRRDRALSTGEAVMAPSEGAKAALAQAKEEALFRSAYSSFAPVRDNSAALISEAEKNQVWWERHGRDMFEYTVIGDGPYYHDMQEDRADGVNVSEDEAQAFEKAVEEFEPVSFEFPLTQDKAAMEERETAEILQEISEMLETLHSFQRIRNSTLSANPKSSIGQNSSLSDLTGTPSTPSSAEVALHDTLRQQLALMVSMLPPYAVAKLNGDQLADLNISRHITIEDTDFRGVMEEDQGSKLARQAALTAAVSGAGASGRPAASTPSAYRPPVASPAGQAAAPRMPTGTGYGSYQPSTMPRGSSFSRSALSGWQQPPGPPHHSPAARPGSYTGYGQTPGASPVVGANRNRAAGQAYPPRQANGQAAAYSGQQRAPAGATPVNFTPTAGGYGVGSPLPRTNTPLAYQAPTPQMTRPGSGSQGAASPAGGRPGSSSHAVGGTESPHKAGAAYPTPSASSAAAAVADSRPHTPASGGNNNHHVAGAGAGAGGANGPPR